ncbi:hypothetical protein HCI99_07400 [Listeria booriae]|uniref:Uncharacterized protein n=1 Tax=Listeria booriae TaxID=1552123 RepID=A0A7X0XCF6_9LIST|nr:hypothetical protein [Listeria booriae]
MIRLPRVSFVLKVMVGFLVLVSAISDVIAFPNRFVTRMYFVLVSSAFQMMVRCKALFL